MARPSSEHLDAAGLHALVDGLSAEGLAVAPQTVAMLTAHVETCRECARKLADYRLARDRLVLLADQTEAAGAGQTSCPPAAAWDSLRTGAAPADEQQRLLDHAVDCSFCCARLAEAMDEGHDMTTEEQADIQSLASARPSWQRSIAAQLRRGSGHRVNRWLVPGAVAAVLCLGVISWLWLRPVNTPTLLARAYTAARPMTFRLPDQGYREVVQSKGAAGSFFGAPPELRDAIQAIDQGLRRTGADPDLLRQKAHALLLEGSYTEALRTLETLSSTDPKNWLLLACAYFLRAESQPQSGGRDYAAALDYLARILQQTPQDSLSRFNLALIEERLPNPAAAIQAWEEFLKSDSTSGYAQEARRHLESLRRKLQARDHVLGAVGEAPARFLALTEDGSPVAAELFLDAALVRWLPRASTDAASQQALVRLATLLGAQAGDTFLLDLLRAPVPPPAVEDLARAITLDRSADPVAGQKLAERAAATFAAAHNRAGELRARVEHVFGLRRSLERDACLAAGQALETELDRSAYPWLAVSALIEKSVCLSYASDMAGAIETAERAARRAATAGLSSLELRALGMLSGDMVHIGNLRAAWRLDPEILERYWSSPYPPNHAHQLYTDLADAASRDGFAHAAFDFRRASVDAISQTPEVLLQASGRNNLSLAAKRAGYDAESAQQEQNVRDLFDRVAASPLRQQYLVDAGLIRAAQEVRQGKPETALQLVADLLRSPLPTDAARVRAWETLGLAHWTRGAFDEARSNAQAAADWSWRLAMSRPSPADRILAAGRETEAYRLLAEIQLSHDHDPAAAFWSWQRYRALQSSSPLAMVTPESVVGELRSETLLSYADLPGGVVVWVLDDGGLTWQRLNVNAAVVAAEGKDLVRRCADPNSDPAELARAARELADGIVEPVRSRLRAGRTLVVDADAALASAPFALLFGPDSPPLVRSAGLAEYLSRASSSALRLADSRLLLVHSPLLPPSLERLYPVLPDATQEADEVAGYFPRVKRLLGKDATPSAVAGSLASAEVFHFSGHGSGDAGDGAILLSPEKAGRPYSGFLTALQMGRQRWGACRLAVLSACSTGVGEGAGPVNPDSLVRGLLNAGVLRVVASQWNVDAESTRRLMSAFYRSLSRGSLPARALSEARAEIRSQAGNSHPYYWAAFQMFGHG